MLLEIKESSICSLLSTRKVLYCVNNFIIFKLNHQVNEANEKKITEVLSTSSSSLSAIFYSLLDGGLTHLIFCFPQFLFSKWNLFCRSLSVIFYSHSLIFPTTSVFCFLIHICISNKTLNLLIFLLSPDFSSFLVEFVFVDLIIQRLLSRRARWPAQDHLNFFIVATISWSLLCSRVYFAVL